jgi:hypothetical protein
LLDQAAQVCASCVDGIQSALVVFDESAALGDWRGRAGRIGARLVQHKDLRRSRFGEAEVTQQSDNGDARRGPQGAATEESKKVPAGWISWVLVIHGTSGYVTSEE